MSAGDVEYHGLNATDPMRGPIMGNELARLRRFDHHQRAFFRSLAVLCALAAGCAHWPATPRLELAGAPGYRLAEATRPGQSDDLLVVLAISGGGMRAATEGT